MATPASDGRLRCARGKFTTKKKIKWKENVLAAVKRRKLDCAGKAEKQVVEGRRIVEFKKLGEDLWCNNTVFIRSILITKVAKINCFPLMKI